LEDDFRWDCKTAIVCNDGAGDREEESGAQGLHADFYLFVNLQSSNYTNFVGVRVFFQGEPLGGIFPKVFLGGPKVVEFVFSHSKLRQPFLLKISKSRVPRPPFRRPCQLDIDPVTTQAFLLASVNDRIVCMHITVVT